MTETDSDSSAPASPRTEPESGSWWATKNLLKTSVLTGLVVAGLGLPAAAAVAIGTNVTINAYDDLPSVIEAPPLPEKSIVKAADGTDIATLYTENRVEVPLADIAVVMQQAVVAIEDSRFYEHNGVDLRGTGRALINNATGEEVQGGSTITMQYVKNVLVTMAKTPEERQAAQARSATRKTQEIKYAIELEQRMTKPEILNNYLNISYFGAGAYGVEAASQRYFGKAASELTLVEAATLAGIVQSPAQYDATVAPEAAQERRNVVLLRMLELGYIDRASYDTAKATPIADYLNPSAPLNGCAVSDYPFFCDYAVRQVKSNPIFGATPEEREEFLATGGLVITTTLNLRAQDAAQGAVSDFIPNKDPSGKAAAIAMVQPGTGNVEAMAQNRDWGTEGAGNTTFNYVVDQQDGGTIGMQAGSTFKIYTIAAALEKGINPYERINARDGLYFPAGDWGCEGKRFESFTGRNSTQSGQFDMFQAAAYSTNTYFLQREKDAGLCDVVNMAKRVGVHTATGNEIEPNISFTLGTTEVSPLTVANSYATFAAHGLLCQPRALLNVTERDGNVIEVPTQCEQVIDREVADATTAVLTNVVDGNIGGRTGANMTLGREATGKTGTTDSQAAVWYAGYTPELAAAVWVGDPRGGFQYPLQDVRINGRYYDKVAGSTLPGPIWQQAMSGALAATPASNFDLKAMYDMKTAQQGGGPDPAMGAVVTAYQEFLRSGSYYYVYGSGQGNRVLITPRNAFGNEKPTFAQFAQYYQQTGGNTGGSSSTNRNSQRSDPTPSPLVSLNLR